jgi:hypothetical protein
MVSRAAAAIRVPCYAVSRKSRKNGCIPYRASEQLERVESRKPKAGKLTISIIVKRYGSGVMNHPQPCLLTSYLPCTKNFLAIIAVNIPHGVILCYSKL